MRIESLSKFEWKEVAAPFSLCTAKFDALLFQEVFDLKPLIYWEDGLGECTAFLFTIQNSQYWVRSFLEYNDQRLFIYVDVPSIEPDSQIAYDKLVKELNLKDVEWVNESLGPASWILTRIDDNGNEIEMQRFLNEISAKHIQRKYEERGHKQAYYVREKT